VTGPPAGEYVLEVELNAEHFYEEFLLRNNSAEVIITIPTV